MRAKTWVVRSLALGLVTWVGWLGPERSAGRMGADPGRRSSPRGECSSRGSGDPTTF